MKQVVALAAALLLAACNTDTCSSSAAQPRSNGGSCVLAVGSTATVDVQLNCQCTDTSAACQAEFVNNALEIAPTVQQCAEQAGCATSGCALSAQRATCSVTIPSGAVPGRYPIVINGATTGQVTIGSSGSGCSL